MAENSVAVRVGWRSIRPYVVALASIVVALLVRMALDPVFGDRQAFFTFMAAVIFNAWFGGAGPSLMVLVISVPLAAWFFIEPRHDLAVVGSQNYLSMMTFTGLALTIVALGGTLWRARRQAEQTEEMCGSQVRELDTERKRLHQELRWLSEELRDVDRRREDFLALLADELRRPLVPIASAASFHSIAATASEMESAMDIVKQETTQLGRLIDDLVDTFRNSQGGIELHRSRLDMTAVASRATEAIRSMAAQAGRELTISLAKEPVWVDGDAARLERVAYNLLMNAIRCTNPGGQIWITVQRVDGDAILKVKDTGIGLAPDAIPRIFQLNSQLDQSLPRERGGLGIGLTAVKPIVEMHGGAVTVSSDGPGQGCEFLVRLPSLNAATSENVVAVQKTPLSGTASDASRPTDV